MIKIMFIFLLVLTACTSPALTEDDLFRIKVLYDHTIIMIEFSTEEQLENVNLDPQYIQNRLGITHEERISQMEQAFGANLSRYSTKEKIDILGEIMSDMMESYE
jgi:hypothetical protein